MLRSHALFFSLVLSLIIAVICSSLILYTHFADLSLYRIDESNRLIRNARSGMNLILSSKATGRIKLFESEQDQVDLIHKSWGVYNLGIARASNGNQTFSKVFLYGGKNSSSLALQMLDYNFPLYVAGNTILNGDVKVPKSGIERAYIGGKSFTGKQLVQGNILQSNRQLPQLDHSLLRHIFSKAYYEDFAQNNVSDLDNNVYRSFLDTTEVIWCNDGFLNQSLGGNIVICSNRSITVSRSCQLENIIVKAPIIIVESGFEGRGQFFASDSIVIKRDVVLNYPSVVGLLKKPISEIKQPYIQIEEDCIVRGDVFAVQETNDRYGCKISIGTKSVIEGNVFTNQFLELKGSVHGQVVCNKFTLKTKSSVYENHLLDAEINILKRDSEFANSTLLGNNDDKQLICEVQ